MTTRKSTGNTGVRSSARTTRGRTTATPAAAMTAEPSRATPAEPAPARGPTKQAVIIGLLQRQQGATLVDLVAATGWLPHTTRAALTRLRQAGYVLDKTMRESGAVYRIAKPPRAVRSRKVA